MSQLRYDVCVARSAAGREAWRRDRPAPKPAATRRPRNSLEGPGYADLDLRLSRDLFFDRVNKGDGPAMTFGIDAFNVLNRLNAVGYVGTLTSPFFGQAVAAQPPRRLQLSIRVRF